MPLLESWLPPAAIPNPRLAPALAGLALSVATGAALRLGLCFRYGSAETARAGDWVSLLLTGVVLDAAMALVVLLPLCTWLLVAPERTFAARAHRTAVHAVLIAGFALVPFTSAIEWFFFDEFDARFNTVAVDYLLYPYEVAGTIRDGYPLGAVLAGSVALALASWLLLRGIIDAADGQPRPGRQGARAGRRGALSGRRRGHHVGPLPRGGRSAVTTSG